LRKVASKMQRDAFLRDFLQARRVVSTTALDFLSEQSFRIASRIHAQRDLIIIPNVYLKRNLKNINRLKR